MPYLFFASTDYCNMNWGWKADKRSDCSVFSFYTSEIKMYLIVKVEYTGIFIIKFYLSAVRGVFKKKKEGLTCSLQTIDCV